jgi:hypothetical protein
VEFVKQKGLTGSARAAADEVLARVGEAKVAVLGAPGYLLHKVSLAGRCVCAPGQWLALTTACCGDATPAACLHTPRPCRCVLLQVQDAVDRLLAFGPVHSAVESAKPSLSAVSSHTHASMCACMHLPVPCSVAVVVVVMPPAGPSWPHLAASTPSPVSPAGQGAVPACARLRGRHTAVQAGVCARVTACRALLLRPQVGPPLSRCWRSVTMLT